MKLTREAKRAFGLFMIENFNIADWETFNNLSELLKNALIIEWLDTVNIFLTIRYNEIAKQFSYMISLNPREDDIHSLAIFKNRQEANNAAIKKANEIHNINHERKNHYNI